MTANKFKKLITENTKKSIVWKIVKGDLKINGFDKNTNITKNQYKKILNMEE